jgi:rhomboid protease GluP
LNGADEARCYRCGKRLPGPLATGALGLARDFLGADAPMTRVVIALELLVFGLCVMADRQLPLGLSGGFRGATLIRFGALYGPVLDSEPWRLLSACFVHGGLLHVGMNMLMFASLGAQLERELGSARSVLLFVVSGILGFVASFLWSGGFAFSVGASGGIFGQVGAFVGLLYARRDPRWKSALVRSLVYALLLTLAIGRVDTAAHFGGFFAGIALGFGLHWEQLRLRMHRAAQVLAAIALLGSVASVVLSAVSPFSQAVRAQQMLGE